MKNFMNKHCSGRRCALAAIVVVVVVSGVWLRTTHSGTVFGTHIVGGFLAPIDVHYACIKETNARVTEKFLQPLNMNRDGVNALNEYWHYAILRECLYRNGYSFLGHVIPPATLVPNNGSGYAYHNPLAGIMLTIPNNATLNTSNALDVAYDYRRYVSEMTVGTTTVTLELYSSFDTITDGITLSKYFSELMPDGVTTVTQEARTRNDGVSYVHAVLSNNNCMAGFYTPHDRIVLVQTPCSEETLLGDLVASLQFTDTVASLH